MIVDSRSLTAIISCLLSFTHGFSRVTRVRRFSSLNRFNGFSESVRHLLDYSENVGAVTVKTVKSSHSLLLITRLKPCVNKRVLLSTARVRARESIAV